MAGIFELFVDADASFRFRLKAPDGTVMAVSKPFGDKAAAVAGITSVREYAGRGLITDLCPEARTGSPAAPAQAPSVQQTQEGRHASAREMHVRSTASRRTFHSRWMGAA
ncbi:DUF1508 domain-containing protein [Arthrobacter sp. ISL-30]|nr:DUF1508 domain-containing protein [Arthrobacter sp. ISL-30]